jgi:hypothetical protein
MFNNLLRQINTYTDRSNRPSKDSPMIEQYEKCEKAIDHQVNRMKQKLETNSSINSIYEYFDPEIKKTCSPWIKKMYARMWHEYGYDDNENEINFENNINNYHLESKKIKNPFYRHIEKHNNKSNMIIGYNHKEFDIDMYKYPKN